MTIGRLRPRPTFAELAQMYPAPHDHRIYGRGHHERVEATIALAGKVLDLPNRQIGPVGDLSCGNGVIARTLQPFAPLRHLGDFAGGEYQVGEQGYIGPLEQTIELMPEVEVYICSETLEHLDDPVSVLAQIRRKAVHLLLSTPLEC